MRMFGTGALVPNPRKALAGYVRLKMKEERRKAFAEAGGRSFDRNTDTQLNK